MNKIRVAGAIASASGVTLYLEDGKQLSLRTDEFRTQGILDTVLPDLTHHRIATVDLDDFSLEKHIERKSGGVIRFFKEKLSSAIATIMPSLTNRPPAELEGGETLVAVVNDVRIPGVEKIMSQLERAVKEDNIVGLHAFLDRVSKVIDKRGHTVDELFNFMQGGDLPIANDGSIIGYKILHKTSEADVFVDPHTEKVRQRLGSYVSMKPEMVDPNRRQECSQGLHIARRQYIRHFGGDLVTLVKVAPEDVIAVPEHESTKMRAAGYHIVAVLPDDAYTLLKQNEPMTKIEVASKILADVIAGNHIGIQEHVRIGAAMGEDITYEAVEAQTMPKSFVSGTAKALDDPDYKNPAVDIRKVQKQVKEARESDILSAAATGDMSAALNAAPEPKKVAKPKKAEAPKPTPAPEQPKSDLPEKYALALKMLDEGKSQRQIEKDLGVAAKTIRKLDRQRKAAQK